MPLPMVHLAVALHLSDGNLPSPEYLLGCLAPDAIHMRPGTNGADKRITHLHCAEGSAGEDVQKVQEISQQLQQVSAPVEFTQGYRLHLLTDRLWTRQQSGPLKAWLPAHLSPAERRSIYYQEADQADFNLYHTMAWRPAIWEILATAVAPDFSPYLSAVEIELWKTRTLRWFMGEEHEPRIQPAFFTDEVIRGFVDRAAQELSSLLTP